VPAPRGAGPSVPLTPYDHATLGLAPGTRLGPDVVSAIGSGGMGEVYRAIARQVADVLEAAY
jgi:hypothetical protein